MSSKVYITGDTHGQFDRVVEFCVQRNTHVDDTLIILGDAGINYYQGSRDLKTKKRLSKLPITLFCIHGNHEMRPSEELGYERCEYHGGQVWVQPEFPNILFAIDGEIYDFLGRDCLVIGGAYSVDKHYRISRGWAWFSDEQPSDEIKGKVEKVLARRDWKVDVVLSHTCPLRYEPVEVFLPMIDQSTVDKSTETWLGEIEDKLSYEEWDCGHYHTKKIIDRLRFFFDDFAELLPRESLQR